MLDIGYWTLDIGYLDVGEKDLTAKKHREASPKVKYAKVESTIETCLLKYFAVYFCCFDSFIEKIELELIRDSRFA